jgi:hypothetical protein
MNRNKLLAAAIAVPIILVSHAALAQSTGAWQYQGAIYAYLPTISGKTTFPQAAAGSDVSVNADQILEHLKGVFMGSLEANNGRWGLFTDLLYMDVGGSKSGTREFQVGHAELPVGASANANFDLKGSVWTLGGSYRLMTTSSTKMDLLAGARLLDIKQKLSWDLTGNIGAVPLPGRAGNLDASIKNWDAIIGLKGKVALGNENKWFAPYYVDVGTGDSDLTWQANAGIGYSFHWGEVIAAWRYLDYKMKSGKPIETINFNGPALAAVWNW